MFQIWFKVFWIKKTGVIVNTYDVNNNLLYSIFCAWDYYKAYYLFGAPSDKHNKPWQGTIGQWAVFRYIVENTNINKFDLKELIVLKEAGLN